MAAVARVRRRGVAQRSRGRKIDARRASAVLTATRHAVSVACYSVTAPPARHGWPKMQGLRSIRRFGAGLGLFALLLQLTLSFAHIHPEDLLGASAAGIAEEAGKVLADRDQDRQLPSASHDDCPICAVMHLAGTIVPTQPPALVVLTEFTVAASERLC